MYYARTDGTADQANWQLLKEHLQNVADMAAQFASTFGGQEYAYRAGLLHDLGKYSSEFQRRLKGSKEQVDHSTAGAQEAVNTYQTKGIILAYLIAGHHAGLVDYGGVAACDPSCLSVRLSKERIRDYQAYHHDLPEPPPFVQKTLPITLPQGSAGLSIAQFIRMLYSCLIDADRLDSQRFTDQESYARRQGYPTLQEMLVRLERYLAAKTAEAEPTLVNTIRAKIQSACSEKAALPPGLFTLTVPTGGAKTLSSLLFALRHALRHDLHRVVYVIPFTSIIEQNAKDFRKAVGDEAVLEHHSNLRYPDEDEDGWSPESERLKLATENWDAPLIVTTNVQFFESLFASRSSRCRKLHNLAGSVIILDEAQMLPLDYLRPCLAALCDLVRNYGTTVVFCTATQPALNALLPSNSQPVELAPEPMELYTALKRVQVVKIGILTDEEVAAKLQTHSRALCIVNTRQHARRIYEHLRSAAPDDCFHLSARMYPKHRSLVLDEIRARLHEKRPCRVVSTQLIEAGVNVDFPVVYRAQTGIDSLAQAAGRCNREGRLGREGRVYLFTPEKHGLPKGWFKKTASIGDMVLRDYDDPLSMAAVQRYFELLYDMGTDLDSKGIMAALEEQYRNLAFPFRTVADKFQIIDELTDTVIIPDDDDSRRLIAEFGPWSDLTDYGRKLQPYMVQVYHPEFQQLYRSGALGDLHGLFFYLRDEGLYDRQLGLTVNQEEVDKYII